jgi:hypothetical protein
MARWMQILWPSFLVGGIAEGLFFSLFDPVELHFFGQPHELSRIAVYTVGFFAFWLVGAASSAFTCYLRITDKDNGN